MTTSAVRVDPGWSRYLTPPRRQLGLGLVCRGLGCQAGLLPPIRSRSLPYAAIVYVRAGAGWMDLDHPGVDGPHRVDAPAVVYLPTGIPHSYGPDPDGWEEEWVLVDGPAIGVYEELGYLSRSRPLRVPGDPVALDGALSALRDIARSGRPSLDVELVPRLHDLIAGLGPGSAGGLDRDDVVLARLAQLALRPITVEELATTLGISLYHLRGIVQARAGCTLKEYVDRVRIDTAQLLLTNSRVPVHQVAARTGYTDPAYFARAFTKRVGLSPRTFRQAFSVRGRPAG